MIQHLRRKGHALKKSAYSEEQIAYALEQAVFGAGNFQPT
jgi:hypothetical protein